MFSSLPAHFLLYLLSLISAIKAVLVNVTVDDDNPDPLTGRVIAYLPAGDWNEGTSCTGCRADVDPQQMNAGTWHDGTYWTANSAHSPSGPLTATFSFNGSAIYAFCALGFTTPGVTTYSNMTFYIDGELVGRFEWIPIAGPNGFEYKVPVYSNSSLSPGQHRFVLQNGQLGNLGNESLSLFDYLVYSYDNGITVASNPTSTSDTSSTSGSSAVPVGAIVGAAVGGIAGLSIIALTIWWFFIQRKRRYSDSLDATPYDLQRSTSQPLMGYNVNNPHSSPVVYAGGRPAASSSSSGSGKPARPYHRNMSSGTLSHALLSSVDVNTSERASSSTPSREVDAGPVVFTAHNERTLPPEYGQVFANTCSR